MKVMTLWMSMVLVSLAPRDLATDHPTPSIISRTDPVREVLTAMEVFAKTEHTTPSKLMVNPHDVATALVDSARAQQIDPLLLVTIAWTESRFRPAAKGDMKNGVPRSCGITQIRTDFKGRPTCEALLDPRVALDWTAKHLASTAKDGRIRLNLYNGGDYEVQIWRKVDWLRRELQVLPV